jgi:ABC-type amino acid transport substrate-binding protein
MPNIRSNKARIASLKHTAYLDEQTGKPTGFAIDIMDEVARRAGLQVRYVIFDKWPPICEAFEEKRIGWTSELEKSTGPKKMPLFS